MVASIYTSPAEAKALPHEGAHTAYLPEHAKLCL